MSCSVFAAPAAIAGLRTASCECARSCSAKRTGRKIAILQLLRKVVGQPRVTARSYAHRPDAAFDVVCRDAICLRRLSTIRFPIPMHSLGPRRFSLSRTVAAELDELRIVRVAAESSFHGLLISLAAVRGRLRPNGQLGPQILLEFDTGQDRMAAECV